MQHSTKGKELHSVIKVWYVIIRVTSVSPGGVVCNTEMVKARKEDQDPDDQHWPGCVTVRTVNVSGQQKGTDCNQQRADQEENSGKSNCLVGNFWSMLLKLKVNVAVITVCEFGVFHLAAGDPSGSIVT